MPEGTGTVTEIRGLASSPRQRNMPTRTHVRRPTGPPLRYFSAVLPCSICSNFASYQVELRRFELLTSCMPSVGGTSPRVHPRRSPSSYVPTSPPGSCPHKSARVRVSCCTSVLYRCHPR